MDALETDAAQRLVLLTAREAANYLRVSLSTLYRMEQTGLLVALRTPGGHRRYTLPMLNACLERARQMRAVLG
ncbi:MAG: excisionase family DNA-binding protein [Chloroflexi bacterium]|nr:excisionase family DNA-binding protein [Chloroflexota bacterium]